MSEAKKCDRCGKFYEPYPDRVNIHCYRSKVREWYDLCPGCNAGFVEWMNAYRDVIRHGRL